MRAAMWTTLAAAVLLTVANLAPASDTVRLGGPGVKADIDGGTDTELIHGRYRWGGWGGGRYYGGFYGGARFYGGYWGGHHARWYGGYGYYRPYYYGSYYASPYYYRPVTYYYTPTYYNDCYYYPITGDSAPTMTLQAQSPAPRTIPPPSATAVPRDGTFPYDGGPASPIPMPSPMNDVNPSKAPRGVVPLDGRLVKLPTQSSGGTSSATSPEIQRLRFTTTTTVAPVRVNYPAYGEEPITPAPRRVIR